MSADKLAKALQRLIKANPVAMNNVQVDAAMEAHKALASHESDRTLSALTAEQRRLGMYEDEKQDPVAIVKVHMTGGNAGLAWSAIPADDAPRLKDGTKLYTSPQQEPELIDLVKELRASLLDATALIDELQQEPDRLDAERYRLLRRGQHWSVIDCIGRDLRADVLDAAIDKAIAAKEAKP